MSQPRSERARTVLRFLVSGATGFLINLGLYSLLIYGAHMWYIAASVIAFLIALLFGFFLQKLFAFRDTTHERSARQFVFYVIFLLFNLCMNALFLFILVENFGVGKLLALVLSNGVIAVWSYFVYEQIIFKRKRPTLSPQMRPIEGAPPNISVVIPCYNEEKSIKAVIGGIPRDVFEIIVVDNNCTDRTAEIARQNGARVVPEKTPGYGAALRAGFGEARGDVIATLDGDCQYPAEEIPAIVEFMRSRNLDFISAARFPLQQKDSMPRLRRIGNWGLSLAANVVFDLGLADSQSGMWVFKRSVLQKITLTQNDMPLSQEIKIKTALNPDIRFSEYHISYHPRIGESKLSPFKHGVILLIHLCKLRSELWADERNLV